MLFEWRDNNLSILSDVIRGRVLMEKPKCTLQFGVNYIVDLASPYLPNNSRWVLEENWYFLGEETRRTEKATGGNGLSHQWELIIIKRVGRGDLFIDQVMKFGGHTLLYNRNRVSGRELVRQRENSWAKEIKASLSKSPSMMNIRKQL